MKQESFLSVSKRVNILYAIVALTGAIFLVRLFYLQIVKHSYYVAQAEATHESKFTIPAERGVIYALDGEAQVPLALNQTLPTLFADPRYVENKPEVAKQLAGVLNASEEELLELLELEGAYVILEKRLEPETVEAVEALEINGIGFTDESYRVYPQESLAAQVLGFVNAEGIGQYGVEEYYQDRLNGQEGQLKAVTDVYGIPLTTNEDNIVKAPVDGNKLTLTIDVNTQKKAEEALAAGVKRSKAESGSIIVYDPNTGAIRAMANYPNYDPSKIDEIDDFSTVLNHVITSPYEAGSVVKALTMSAGLNEGVVTPETEYYDAGYVQVDDRTIENAGVSGGVNRSMNGVIQNSVNTGVVYVLQQLGGGEINEAGRTVLHSYFTEKYGLGKPTGVGHALEGAGTIFEPTTGAGDNVRYANMTFGQGMTVTMLQMAAALSAAINGGDYYQPYLVHSSEDSEGIETVSEPQIVREGVISDETSQDLRSMMKLVVENGGGHTAKRDGYFIGGKTGTSQVIDEETGEYTEDREVGSFIGFGASEDKAEYVIMVRVDEPQIPGYAGSVAAAPIFAEMSNWLIDYYQIAPIE